MSWAQSPYGHPGAGAAGAVNWKPTGSQLEATGTGLLAQGRPYRPDDTALPMLGGAGHHSDEPANSLTQIEPRHLRRSSRLSA